jgi:hypothetical protein
MRILPALLPFCVAFVLVVGTFGCSSTQPNPTVPPAVTTDSAVGQILATSCYDCHSNEGADQWYAKLQPSRWFGNSALESLNFSDWGTYDTQHRADAIRQIAAVVDSGTMPPGGYLLFHPGARLSPEQKTAIAKWAAAQGAVAAH